MRKKSPVDFFSPDRYHIVIFICEKLKDKDGRLECPAEKAKTAAAPARLKRGAARLFPCGLSAVLFFVR
ncbi:protein of unknown function [Ruminococcaceae bacterium BL-6]|nr:protein of unknown function [Ruminococcaceae bacterium BL-6]